MEEAPPQDCRQPGRWIAPKYVLPMRQWVSSGASGIVFSLGNLLSSARTNSILVDTIELAVVM